MEWDVAVLFAVLGGMGTMWWKIDVKFDALSKLLNDNLIAINREIGGLKGNIGEIKGQAQARNPTN